MTVGLYLFPLTGAQVPITSYTCTQPNIAVFLDREQCTVSGGLRMCAIKEGARPALLSSSCTLGVYAWHGNTNPFVVLDIPQGWCVGIVKMTFRAPGSIPRSLWQKVLLASLHLRHQFAEMRSPPSQHLECSPRHILARYTIPTTAATGKTPR